MIGGLEKVELPSGEVGTAKVSKVVVPPPSELDLARAYLRNNGRYVPAGEYTQLHINGSLMMSDTPDEMRDHLEPVRMAKGICLVNGLGLGMVAQAMAAKADVARVIVVENNPDVITLVAPHMHEKVEVVDADAFDYDPPKGVMFGAVWHDIWRDICTDNLPEITRLKRKYGRRTEWQGAWVEGLLRYEKRRQDREDRRWAW